MSKPKITYDMQLIKVISLFESITKTQLRDCFEMGDTLYFVLDTESMGKAIGKSGANVKRLQALMKRKIKMLEHSEDLATFIRNLIYPITARQIEITEGKIVITGQETKDKAILIGRNASNLNQLKSIIQRYFEITELKVM